MTRRTLIVMIQTRLQSLYTGFAGEGNICTYDLNRLIEYYRVLAVHNALDQQ